MNEILKQLIELQGVDSRILEIEEMKGDLPEKVQLISEKSESITKENADSNNRLEEIEKELRSLNGDTGDNTNKLKKYKEQLYLVTSNKEYDALLHEIDTIKMTISDSETKILLLEDEKSQLEETVKSNELKLEDMSVVQEKQKKELTEAISKTKSEENKLMKARQGFIKGINPQYLSNYERYRKARSGHGIVSVTRNSCGHCYYRLPAQTIVEIKGREKIINCPSCGIYLFWEEE